MLNWWCKHVVCNTRVQISEHVFNKTWCINISNYSFHFVDLHCEHLPNKWHCNLTLQCILEHLCNTNPNKTTEGLTKIHIWIIIFHYKSQCGTLWLSLIIKSKNCLSLLQSTEQPWLNKLIWFHKIILSVHPVLVHVHVI